MTELLLNPDMFSKVREEVSAIVGEDGKIQEAKILDLHYSNAVIKETRCLRLLVPHKTETEVKLGEYVVPKNTQILVNAWAMARDPSYWEDPVMFKVVGLMVASFVYHFEWKLPHAREEMDVNDMFGLHYLEQHLLLLPPYPSHRRHNF
nr:geraniol 8-hydroxylase-like [Tanacetum cinerariifolium]